VKAWTDRTNGRAGSIAPRARFTNCVLSRANNVPEGSERETFLVRAAFAKPIFEDVQIHGCAISPSIRQASPVSSSSFYADSGPDLKALMKAREIAIDQIQAAIPASLSSRRIKRPSGSILRFLRTIQRLASKLPNSRLRPSTQQVRLAFVRRAL
jgi:hypothetical protein